MQKKRREAEKQSQETDNIWAIDSEALELNQNISDKGMNIRDAFCSFSASRCGKIECIT